MSQVQEASLRVILAGRTGLDATLRKDPSIELLRVKTPVELIGELSQPIDDLSPAEAVVVIGPEVEPMVDAADMVGALRMISPRVRVIVSTTTHPTQQGFDGVVKPDTSAESFRAMLRRLPALNGTPAAKPAAAIPPQPHLAPSPVPLPNPAMLSINGGVVPQGFIISSAMPAAIRPFGKPATPVKQATPSKPATVVTPTQPVPAEPPIESSPAPQIEVTSAARHPITPRQQAPSLLTPFTADLLGDPLALDLHATGTESLTGPIDITLRSTVDDRDVLTAVTAGRNPIPPALALLRLRTAASDIAYHAGDSTPHPSPIAGAPVIVGGQTLGHLISDKARPEQLADAATWLAGWLLLREAHAQACRGTFTDGLTGAYNRRFFDCYLPVALKHAHQHRHDLSVLLFDIDNFKTFNDRYGHAAGDQILSETVKLLRSQVRADDRVCRLGGDEFAVVYFEPKGPRAPGSRHPDDAAVAAARFRAAIQAHRFPRLGPEAVGKLTISGGLATFPWHGLTPEALLAAADASLYQAKRQGKNAIIIG